MLSESNASPPGRGHTAAPTRRADRRVDLAVRPRPSGLAPLPPRWRPGPLRHRHARRQTHVLQDRASHCGLGYHRDEAHPDSDAPRATKNISGPRTFHQGGPVQRAGASRPRCQRIRSSHLGRSRRRREQQWIASRRAGRIPITASGSTARTSPLFSLALPFRDSRPELFLLRTRPSRAGPCIPRLPLRDMTSSGIRRRHWHHLTAPARVGCEHSREAQQRRSGWGNQRGQPRHEFHRLHQAMRLASAPRLLQAIRDAPITREREPLKAHRRSRHVPAQPIAVSFWLLAFSSVGSIARSSCIAGIGSEMQHSLANG